MYDLLKFTEEKYAEDLLCGKLYMNPLSFFKKIEGSQNDQMDPLEGFIGYISHDQIENYFPHESVFDIPGAKIGIINELHNIYNVFCMYSLYRDENKKLLQPISSKFLENSVFGNCCVYVYDTVEFIRRITKAIEKKCDELEVAVGIWGAIRYISSNESAGDLSIFDKNKGYQDQNEWRLAVASIYSWDTPIILEIGDIHDIAKKILRSDLVTEIQKMYSSYQYSTDNLSAAAGLSIYGNRTVTNHFLNSFLQLNTGTKRAPSEIQIILNNADNYKLQGNTLGGIEYLKGEFLRTRKVEVFEIFASYLESSRLIDKEKIFNSCLEHLITEDRDFFFSRNGYLTMIHCLKLFPSKTLAARLFGTLNEIQELTEADKKEVRLLTASVLECYDQLDCYNQDNTLPNHYLKYEIIKNLYTLHWEEAAEVLAKYVHDISSLLFELKPLTYQIGVLLKKGMPDHNEEINDMISEYCAEAQKTCYICQNSRGDCLLSVRFLLTLALNKNFDMFDSLCTLYITPNTVKILVDWYVNTGNQTVCTILNWLRENRSKLVFISPDISELASLYCEHPELEAENLLNPLVQYKLQMDLKQFL